MREVHLLEPCGERSGADLDAEGLGFGGDPGRGPAGPLQGTHRVARRSCFMIASIRGITSSIFSPWTGARPLIYGFAQLRRPDPAALAARGPR